MYVCDVPTSLYMLYTVHVRVWELVMEYGMGNPFSFFVIIIKELDVVVESWRPDDESSSQISHFAHQRYVVSR